MAQGPMGLGSFPLLVSCTFSPFVVPIHLSSRFHFATTPSLEPQVVLQSEKIMTLETGFFLRAKLKNYTLLI